MGVGGLQQGPSEPQSPETMTGAPPPSWEPGPTEVPTQAGLVSLPASHQERQGLRSRVGGGDVAVLNGPQHRRGTVACPQPLPRLLFRYPTPRSHPGDPGASRHLHPWLGPRASRSSGHWGRFDPPFLSHEA